MTSRILIAFDDSENAMRAVEYVARFFLPTAEVTLFNVTIDSEALCRMNSPELIPYFRSQQSTFCAMEDKKREIIEQSMKKAVSVLNSAGFPPDNVHTKFQRQKKSVAKDIVEEARNRCDMIVIGRKGVSEFKDFFMGSTSNKVLNIAEDISVMIVP